MTAVSPSRDDDATTRAARRCSGCGQTFAPTGRQVHCSTACRKRVFRARHAADVVVELPVRRAAADPTAPDTTAPARTRREHTVYECPDCGERQLGTQRCTACGRFGRAVGLGGACPGCGEPVTVGDLDLEPKVSR
jgi:predicted RNA-binding Zn-ribbon protein involved in translation (DUF1610 family)